LQGGLKSEQVGEGGGLSPLPPAPPHFNHWLAWVAGYIAGRFIRPNAAIHPTITEIDVEQLR